MKENTNNKVQKIDFSSQTTKSQLPAKVHSKVISGQFFSKLTEYHFKTVRQNYK